MEPLALASLASHFNEFPRVWRGVGVSAHPSYKAGGRYVERPIILTERKALHRSFFCSSP